ncbi:MAG: 3-phosphoshikimate 1-carboxyvinyltransferase [Chloroflexota bacterium]
MNVSLAKSEISGTVRAPSSKSYTIRGMMCGALAPGTSDIRHPLLADDTEAAAEVLGKIGVAVTKQEDVWQVCGGSLRAPAGELFCRDSAATLRFLTALCALVPGECRLTAGPSLARRPVKPLVTALQKLGVKCSSEGEFPPVTVTGGRLEGNSTEIRGDISSQFISALLLIAPRAARGMNIRLTTPLVSRPYLEMTLDCMQTFGVKVTARDDGFTAKRQDYRPARYDVEGDWSSASYLLALGATGGEVTVTNLEPASRQGDRVLLDFLQEMGAPVNVNRREVTVRNAALRSLKADLSDCIDLLPTMAVLAAAADGTSELTGIRRARLKESDRVAAVAEGLNQLGIRNTVEEDRMVITGGRPHRGSISSWGDHRIAMAFSVLGAAFGGVTVKDAESVGKTFPDFWAILEKMGGRLTRDEQ